MKRLVLATVVNCMSVGTWKTVDDKSGKVVLQVQLYKGN